MSRVNETQDRAAYWIVAREEPGWCQDDQFAFESWLAQSDLNRVTFLRLEQSWREADRMRSLRPPVMRSASRTKLFGGRAGRPLFLAKSLAAAASLAIVLWIGSHQVGLRTPIVAQLDKNQYGTQIGGHRLVGLSDGSKVELNTSSIVRTAVGGARREVWLDNGEAYFEVAHDKNRPFVVHAGTRKITVLGTKFSVRRDGEKVIVSVREGRVRVDDIRDAGALRSNIITDGDIAIAQGSTTLVAAKVTDRVDTSLAWREGMLDFDREKLIDVANEFNRYNRQKLIVVGSAVKAMRIGGRFPATRPRDFVQLLHDAYGLEIEVNGSIIRISS